MINKQALNKKLAEWWWGKDGIEVIEDGKYIYYHTKWHEEEKEWGIEAAPNFPNDLNACFKWLVPKLWASGLQVIVSMLSSTNHLAKVVDAFGKMEDIVAVAETPALALCLAIEKLIDEKK